MPSYAKRCPKDPTNGVGIDTKPAILLLRFRYRAPQTSAQAVLENKASHVTSFLPTRALPKGLMMLLPRTD